MILFVASLITICDKHLICHKWYRLSMGFLYKTEPNNGCQLSIDVTSYSEHNGSRTFLTSLGRMSGATSRTECSHAHRECPCVCPGHRECPCVCPGHRECPCVCPAHRECPCVCPAHRGNVHVYVLATVNVHVYVLATGPCPCVCPGHRECPCVCSAGLPGMSMCMSITTSHQIVWYGYVQTSLSGV